MSQLHNPSWLLRSRRDVQQLLRNVSSTVLWDAYVLVRGQLTLGVRKARDYYVEDLTSAWVEHTSRCASMCTELLYAFCLDVVGDETVFASYSQPVRRHVLLAFIFRKVFGPHFFHEMCSFSFRDSSAWERRLELLFAEDQMPSVPALKDRFLQLSHPFVVGILKRAHPSFGWKLSRFQSHTHAAGVAADYFRTCVSHLEKCDDEQMLDVLLCVAPFCDVDPITCDDLPRLFFAVLKMIFGVPFVDSVFRSFRPLQPSDEESFEWPRKVDDAVVNDRLRAYFESTCYKLPDPCAVCGRSKDGVAVTYVSSASDDFNRMNFHLLNFPTSIVPKHVAGHFLHPHPLLNDKVLDFSVVRVDHTTGIVSIPVCSSCSSYLRRPSRPRIPKFALANGLYRGNLPDEFKDLTWVEEAVCSIYRSTAVVTRLYGTKDTDARNPFKLRGNTVAHQMNVSSTARALPRTPADVLGMISVVFIGTASLDKVYLRDIFRVRKRKIMRFLSFLKQNNSLYFNMEIDESVLAMYPDDSALPGVSDSVIHVKMPADDVFDEDTSGATEHPAATLLSQSNSPDFSGEDFFFERSGVSDPEGSTLLGRDLQASAIRNVSISSSNSPDLALSHSQRLVPEYDNPALLPGMFPTLFPYGCGGFENKQQKPSLSFRVQAESYLDSSDRVFRKHNSFVFVVLNMWQRREAHIHTYLTVSKPNFDRVASRLVAVSPDVLTSLAKRIESEGRLSNLSEEERRAFQLLNYVNSVSSNVPGSQASKLKMRNEIVSYAGFFGIPSLFLTLNPCAQHSPVFQVMVGDTSVSLDTRFPTLVPSKERAVRLASDPVAAADFFEFSMKCIFRDLFGWDFEARCSATTGILGDLAAFYGSCEFNNRGQLHGHFLLYLEGAPNPPEIHRRLKSSLSYQEQFFEFFENIIYHDLPDVHCFELADAKYECRVERPVPPPPLLSSSDDYAVWRVAFEYDVKKCGEKLQRHIHKSVCSKYKKDGKCRFLFPHEVVERSFFDEENDAIVLAVRDSTVNYHNRYLLVFCRHNHDIRFILSGKGAKAAMFYITDYITKMDVKTYQVLSMLSKAVCDFTRMSSAEDNECTDVLFCAKMLLHKCLSQFSRQQEIHAQQAVRYIRGLTDSFSSHETVSMCSNALVAFVRRQYGLAAVEQPEAVDTEDAQDSEVVRVAIDSEGQLIRAGRIADYFFREDRLKDLSFYDFVRCFRRRKSRSLQVLDGGKTFNFKTGHQLSATHVLFQLGEQAYDKHHLGLIPRVYGMSIPKAKVGDEYYLFMLCHFKPFGVDFPLFGMDDSVEETFRSFPFSSRSRQVMDNWESLNECEDARDLDRQKQRDAYAKEGRLHADLSKTTRSIADSIDDMGTDNDVGSAAATFRDELEAQRISLSLQGAGWFSRSVPSSLGSNVAEFEDTATSSHGAPPLLSLLPTSSTPLFPSNVSSNMMKEWRRQIKAAEAEVCRVRRQALVEVNESENPLDIGDDVRETVVAPVSSSSEEVHVRETVTFSSATESTSYSQEEFARKIADIRQQHGLNEMQTVAYNIIVNSYVDLQDKRARGCEDEHEPLRMFLTGPGGTGKTHVVNCVKEMMGLYKASHRIRFLAPTGSAAALIDGMTIHRGLGISISETKNSDGTSWNVHVSVKNRKNLRDEWRDVDVVMIDEVSMVSLSLMCQLDHAFRYVKEKPDKYFGGIEFIVGGDLYQLPPVKNSALYDCIRVKGKANDVEIQKRLGALAWHSITKVVELTEQMRMRDDPEYAAAVLRLRKRVCIPSDVDLFNSRVIKSNASHLFDDRGSVDLSTEVALNASVLVSTNVQRLAINMLKARSNCSAAGSPELHVCEALDVYADTNKLVSNNPPHFDRDHILRLPVGGSEKSKGKIHFLKLPGLIPFYIGMPVVIRDKNISTDLRITNGARGTIVHMTFKPSSIVGDAERKVADILFVHVPSCPLRLRGLPPSVVPLSCVSSAFGVSPPSVSSDEKTRFIRYQQTVQPAFAMTCHGAQGQTCPFVITDLAAGSFHAYVAASRPKTRYQLAITSKVTLEDLRRELPENLRKESLRLDALAHNTLVAAGVLHAPVKEVPGIPFSTSFTNLCSVVFDDAEDNLHENESETRNNAESRVSFPLVDSACDSGELYSRFRCRWKSNYSCAYDAAVVSLTILFFALPPRFKLAFRAISQHTSDLSNYAELLQNDRDAEYVLEDARDDLRAKLSAFDGTMFPLTDAALIDVTDIFNIITNRQSYPFKLRLVADCAGCGSLASSVLDAYAGDQCMTLQLCPHRGHGRVHLTDNVAKVTYSTVGMEMNSLMPFSNTVYTSVKEVHAVTCPGQLRFRFAFVDPPPFLYFEVSAENDVLCYASKVMSVSSEHIRYSLCAIIYFSSSHFRCQLFSREFVYKYDGMLAGGVLRKFCHISDVTVEETNSVRSDLFDGQVPRLFLYARTG